MKTLLLDYAVIPAGVHYQSLVKNISLKSGEYRFFDVAGLDQERYGESAASGLPGSHQK